jgi:predicted nucleic acid-binding protein
MTEYYPFILIDTGIIVAFYNKGDRYHQQVVNFMDTIGQKAQERGLIPEILESLLNEDV